MRGMARPHKRLQVKAEDRGQMEAWQRAGTTPRRLAERSKIVLLCGQGMSVEEVAAKLDVNRNTVYKWRRRYESEGLKGLEDRPRPGQPLKLSAGQAEEILHLTVHRIPRESTHWSIRLMMKYAGVSQHQVMKVWKAAGLKPHLLRGFKISNDPDFAAKVRDVVGLYLDPPDNALVLSVDEKTQVQALERSQPMLPMKRGQAQRRTHDCRRHGTASLYAAFDVATGRVMGRITKRHRSREFLAFLRQIERAADPELDLHLILDNSSTHKTEEVRRWLEKRPRFKLHFTPTSASWLNAVENWFSQLERRAIHRNSFTGVQQLRREIRRYITVHNHELAKPFRWTKEAEVIIGKVERPREVNAMN